MAATRGSCAAIAIVAILAWAAHGRDLSAGGAMGLSASMEMEWLSRTGSQDTPLTRVVKMLEEMRAEVSKEAKEDEEVYSKFACWCDTNKAEKEAAVEEAKETIARSTEMIEVGTAKVAELTGEVETLKGEVEEGQQALEQAAVQREKRVAEFQEEEKDLKETLGALKEAVDVLGKVQLLQKQRGAVPPAAQAALLQVRSLVSRAPLTGAMRSSKRYAASMQKDLWDLLGEPALGGPQGRTITGLQQQPAGGVMGAKSYNSRSGQIFGILTQMLADMSEDLVQAHKEEIDAEIAYWRMHSAKTAELQAMMDSIAEKSAIIADTNQKVAQAKEDLESATANLGALEKFLVDLEKRCSQGEKEYHERQKSRSDEVVALGEVIAMLTSDEARDLFSDALSFLQTQEQSASRRARQQAARAKAAERLLRLARKGGAEALALAGLAVSVQSDVFDKVKEVMDKMIAELKKQQAEEVKKHDACRVDLDTNEDETMVKESEKKDLDAKVKDLTATIEGLEAELEDLKTQIAEAHVALKTASENRKQENKDFQQTVSDQRAVVMILQKAIKRMESFYGDQGHKGRAAALQIKRQPDLTMDPPSSGKEYSKSEGAAGVMHLLQKVVEDAKSADAEAVVAEQHSQEAYEEMIRNTNTLLDTSTEAISAKTIELERANGDKVLAEKDTAATVAALEDLAGVKLALHQSCDFLLKNFNIRQTARQEEIEAIQEAKAILSGADFGF